MPPSPEHQIGRPENGCNLDQILIYWGSKCAGVFWRRVYGKAQLE